MEKPEETVREPIARSDWSSFVETFAGSHRHWIVYVESGCGPMDTEPDAPLQLFGGNYDERRNEARFELCRGGGDKCEEIRCDDVSGIYAEQTRQGAHNGLVIESRSGITTRIHFRVPAFPELLDGMA